MQIFTAKRLPVSELLVFQTGFNIFFMRNCCKILFNSKVCREQFNEEKKKRPSQKGFFHLTATRIIYEIIFFS